MICVCIGGQTQLREVVNVSPLCFPDLLLSASDKIVSPRPLQCENRGYATHFTHVSVVLHV